MSDQLELITRLFTKIDSLSYDKESIAQDKLDIVNKLRSSIFSWRGQFSPELVEILLDYYSHQDSVILDPFVGSGTTLFEASRKGLTCYGTEINPAAIEMAKTSLFINLEPQQRQKVIQSVESIINEYIPPSQLDLFTYQNFSNQDFKPQNFDEFIGNFLENKNKDELVENIINNAIIRYFNLSESKDMNDFRCKVQEQIDIIKQLPYSKKTCRVFHSDAKSIPLADSSIDLIITSPPYINVFNYHQNNRSAMELLGWNLLNVAKSEIGANRKHRQNRFLTVIQYSLDMLDILIEMRRLLRPNGRAIIVIGRESSIRNVSIKNTKLLAAIALGGVSFNLERIQERKFKNKFGELIYEDILHLIPAPVKILANDEFACLVGQAILTQICEQAEGEIREEIIKAKQNAKTVKKSQVFQLNHHQPILVKSY